MIDFYVISLIYVDKRDTGIHFQAVGRTAEAAVDQLNVKIAEWRDEHFDQEELESGDSGAPCLFQLDGAWTTAETEEPELPLDNPNSDPSCELAEEHKRALDVQDQLNRWLQACMDAYVADVSFVSMQ